MEKKEVINKMSKVNDKRESMITTAIVMGRLEIGCQKTAMTEVLLDTGASFNCVNENFFNKNFSDVWISPDPNRRIFDATNKIIELRGVVKLNVRLSSKNEESETLLLKEIEFLVVDNLSYNIIIGFPDLMRVGMTIKSEKIILNNLEFSMGTAEQLKIQSLKLEHKFELKEAVCLVDTMSGSKFTILSLESVEKNPSNLKSGKYRVNFLPDKNLTEIPSPESNGYLFNASFQLTKGKVGYLGLVVLSGNWESVPKFVFCATRTGTFRDQINNIAHKKTILESRDNKNSKSVKEFIAGMIKDTKLDKDIIRPLIENFSHIFASTENDIGIYIDTIDLRLRDPTADPAYCKPRTVPFALRPWLDLKLQDMVEAGLISVANNSPFSAPINIVKKKTPGSYRLTIDYRLLNKAIVANRFPIPNIKTMLEELSGSRYFSICDLRSGFWQLQLSESSKDCTAFAARGRLYKWEVLPMGLSCSPGIFQSVMMTVLKEQMFKTAICYLDDVVIFTKSEQDHYHALESVFKRFQEAGLRLHPEKSFFGVESIDFLGYTVNANGYRPLRSKVDDILKIATPTNTTELKSFIGSIGFYTQSLPALQYTLDPLHSISGKRSKFIWGEEQENSFQMAKDLLRSVGPLGFPSKGEQSQLIITTDASDKGYGGVLAEIIENGVESPLGYFSGTFKGSQINWPIMEKELYSLYFGCNYFYAQLMAVHFTWRTDNKALSTFTVSTSLKTKASGAPNSRVIRWIEFLSMFEFSIVLVQGTSAEMALSDCLSRMNKKCEKSVNGNIMNIKHQILKLPYWTIPGCEVVDFLKCQQKDKELVRRKGKWFRYTKGKNKARFRINDDGIHQIKFKNSKWLFMVPKSLYNNIFNFYHLANHNSAKKMTSEIRNTLFIPRLPKLLNQYINSCLTCLQVNHKPPVKSQPIKTSTIYHPWHCVQVDLLGPLPTTLQGNKYILSAIDCATGWNELRAIADKTAENTLSAINDIILVRGPPQNLQTDGGAEFNNTLISDYLDKIGIYKNRITPYRPQSNGAVEVNNKKITRLLKIWKVPEITWDEWLKSIQLSINLTKRTSGYSPWSLMHSWCLYRPAFVASEYNMDEHIKYCENESEWSRQQTIKLAKSLSETFSGLELEKQNRLSDKEVPEEVFEIDQKVVVYFPQDRKSKFFAKWKSVYKITEKMDVNTFIVADVVNPRKKFIVHRSRLRKIGPGITSFSDDENDEEEKEEGSNIQPIETSDPRNEGCELTVSSTVQEDKNQNGEEGVENKGDNNEMIVIEEESQEQYDKDHIEHGPEIEIQIPEEDVPEVESEIIRPKRRAALKGREKVRNWAKIIK